MGRSIMGGRRKHGDTSPCEPSPREVRRRWADEGNVKALLDLIRDTPWSMFSVGEQLQNLMIACRAAAKAAPEAFSREVFSEMVAFNAFLTIRTQLYIGQMVVGSGAMPCTPSLADFPIDTVERLLPRLLEMQRSMAEVLHAQAATARMWALTEAKRVRGGREWPRPARRVGSPSVNVAPPAREGTTTEEPRDIVSLPERRRRRG